MMDAKLLGMPYDREAYATGLPVPHLAGLVYLVKIATNSLAYELSEMSGMKGLNAWKCSNYSQFQSGKHGRVNCNEEVPLHFWRLAPGN